MQGDRIREMRKRAVRWVVGLGVTILSCWLLVQDLDWRGVARALTTADYRWAAVAVLFVIASFFTRTYRWRALLGRPGLPSRPLMTALLVGQVFNMALPVRSGDVVRAAWLGVDRDGDPAGVLGSIAVEKAWDLLALLVCGLVLLVLMPLPGWLVRSTWGAALALALVGAFLWLALRWRAGLARWAGRLLARLPAGWDRLMLPHLRRLADGLETASRLGAAPPALLWTGLTWALGGLVNLAVLAAFGLPSVVAALFLLTALMAGAAVPTPAGLGLFESICVVALAFLGVSRDRALAVGLLLHLVVMGPPLVTAGLLALWPAARLRSEDGRP